MYNRCTPFKGSNDTEIQNGWIVDTMPCYAMPCHALLRALLIFALAYATPQKHTHTVLTATK